MLLDKDSLENCLLNSGGGRKKKNPTKPGRGNTKKKNCHS